MKRTVTKKKKKKKKKRNNASMLSGRSRSSQLVLDEIMEEVIAENEQTDTEQQRTKQKAEL